MKIQVVNAMDPKEVSKIAQLSADTINSIAEQLRQMGIDENHTGSVLMVAIAGILMDADVTPEQFFDGIKNAKKLWVKAEGGWSIRKSTLENAQRPAVTGN